MTMFPTHDPYFHLIKSVAEINGCKIDLIKNNQTTKTDSLCKGCISSDIQKLQYYLTGLKSERKDLISKLKDSYVDIMYKDRYVRAAYMLLYFPFYIEPIYYVTQTHINKLVNPDTSKIKICFIGGGPLPELLGLGKAISTIKSIKKINCTVLDIVPHWVTERDCCTKLMLKKEYFPGECNISHEKFDLWSEALVIPDIISEADIVVSQNCINDCPKGKEDILNKNFQSIWSDLKSESSLIIIDLCYQSVRNLLTKLQSLVRKTNGKVIQDIEFDELSRNNNSALNFSFSECEHIVSNLGQPKRYTKYHSVIYQKL